LVSRIAILISELLHNAAFAGCPSVLAITPEAECVAPN
jgi:hypothetical protein